MLITKTDIIEESVSHIRNLSSVFGRDQSQWKIVVFFLCVILSNIVHANTGVFLGSGCEVIPFRNDHIQLKGEEVFITVTIPKNSAEFGVGFIPRLYVKADFHLYNTSVEKIPLQLGFPVVTSEDPSDPHKMNFQVGSSGQTYTTQIKKGAIEKSLDPSGSFKQVIVWNDNFEPRGMKDIKVTYDLSMSLVLLDTNRKLGAYGLTFFFPYITKTAYTWKQPLEKAVFRFDFSDIISYLNSSKYSEQVIFKEEQNNFSGPCLIYLRYPIGGEISNSILTMTYNDRVPEEGLIYYIDAVNLPATLTGFESYFKIMPEVYERANKNTFHKKPYDETEILWNLLNLYKGLYQGKITESLWNDGTIMGLPQNTEEKKNCLIEYNTYLFGQDSRAEVAKIINFIEEQLGIKKPSWIQRLYRSVVGMFTHDPK